MAGVVIALSFIACGDDQAASVRSDTQANREAEPAPAARSIAETALLQLADLPADWHARSRPPDLRCPSSPFRAADARAASSAFLEENTGIQESVGVFRTAAASRRAFARLNSPASMACVRRNARREMSEQTAGEASRPALARVESLGRWVTVSRFTATSASQIGIVSGVIDAVHARVGRGVGALVIASGLGPVRDELYDDVIAAFTRRLRQAFG